MTEKPKQTSAFRVAKRLASSWIVPLLGGAAGGAMILVVGFPF